jgi:hypothetical protein
MRLRRGSKKKLSRVKGALCLLEALEVPKVLDVMRCVLLCMLEVVEGDALCAALYAEGRGVALCFLEALEAIICVLLCVLEGVECELFLLETLEACFVYCSVCWRPWRLSSGCWRRWKRWRRCCVLEMLYVPEVLEGVCCEPL